MRQRPAHGHTGGPQCTPHKVALSSIPAAPPRSGHVKEKRSKIDLRVPEKTSQRTGASTRRWKWTTERSGPSRGQLELRHGMARGHRMIGQRLFPTTPCLGVSAESKTLPRYSDCISAKSPDLSLSPVPPILHWHCVPIGVGRKRGRTRVVESDKPRFEG